MDTISREYRLRQWALAISEQKHSGLTIKEWCEQNGVRRDQFFYRQRQVRKALAEAAGLNYGTVQSGNRRIFAEIASSQPATPAAGEEAGAFIHTAGVEIRLTNAASVELIRNILNAARPC